MQTESVYYETHVPCAPHCPESKNEFHQRLTKTGNLNQWGHDFIFKNVIFFQCSWEFIWGIKLGDSKQMGSGKMWDASGRGFGKQRSVGRS